MSNKTTQSNAKYDLAEKVRISISLNYAEKFSLKKLAGELYVNECHILRTFKEITGYTPLEYHNRVRCEKACRLLENPDLSISYVSDMVGYSTQAHFSRIFKSIYNCTPTEYRRRHLSDRRLVDVS